jgi:hypothetical protein
MRKADTSIGHSMKRKNPNLRKKMTSKMRFWIKLKKEETLRIMTSLEDWFDYKKIQERL